MASIVSSDDVVLSNKPTIIVAFPGKKPPGYHLETSQLENLNLSHHPPRVHPSHVQYLRFFLPILLHLHFHISTIIMENAPIPVIDKNIPGLLQSQGNPEDNLKYRN